MKIISNFLPPLSLKTYLYKTVFFEKIKPWSYSTIKIQLYWPVQGVLKASIDLDNFSSTLLQIYSRHFGSQHKLLWEKTPYRMSRWIARGHLTLTNSPISYTSIYQPLSLFLVAQIQLIFGTVCNSAFLVNMLMDPILCNRLNLVQNGGWMCKNSYIFCKTI